MESDGAKTPEEEPPVHLSGRSKDKLLAPVSNKAETKRKRGKKRSKRKRGRSTSTSSSSSTTTDASSTPPRCKSKKRKTTSTWSRNEVLDLLNVFHEGTRKSSRSFSNNHLNNVVPEFDPSCKTQSVESWIRKVNECAVIYDWDEKQTIHFALQKLAGLAKKWFETLPSVVFSWIEWQAKLTRAFPSEQNYGRLLEEMLARTTRNNENLTEYFYDKLMLIHRCHISGKKAVDCITHGIYDKSIRNGAQALNCNEPEDLLHYLSSQRALSESVSANNKKRHDLVSPPTSSMNTSSIICFNCRSKGHPYYKCSKPLVRCLKCHRVGHNNENCKLTPLPPQTETKSGDNLERKTLTISIYSDRNKKFFKQVEINNQAFSGYIDFGSECSLMRESDANSLDPSKTFSKLPIIKGFGNSAVTPLYSTFVNLKIDDIESIVEVLVVNDEFMQTSLLIGQNFTELPSIAVFKNDSTLFVYKTPELQEKPSDLNSLKLTLPNDIQLARNKSELVEVSALDSFSSGDVYVEGYSSNKPGKEYNLHQGTYRISTGKCYLVLSNLSDHTLNLNKNTLIARATPFEEKEILCINKIATDITRLAPLVKSEIKVGPQVDDKTMDRLYDLLQSYRDCFAFNLSEIGCNDSIEMKIDLLDDKPVVYRPYRLSHFERGQVRDIINDLLQNDIIQESDSNYASPIVIVKKKTGEQRLCVDYRSLNNKTRKDCFPLPLIDDQITNLSGNRFFTSLDLASGYYQVPMAKESRPLTAFVTPDGHYEFKRMPFGLANAPAVFQRVINQMLGAKRYESALAYLDDILVPSTDLEEGFRRLEDILKLMRENGLTLKLSKCRFFDTTINYLGYEISANGIRPNENKVLAVKEFPIPRNIHEVSQFLGLAGYFRKFVKNFGEIARPLTNLLKKGNPFTWGEDQSQAFSSLKDHLINRPILALYNPKLATELHTDASALGVGGILVQWQSSPRVLKPVAYFSRQTTPEERHLHSYELETLAIVCSLKKFRVYLLGLEFKIVTDCNALRTTLTKRDLIPRIARWWLQISEFTFTIEYRPGTRMAHVDALSRNTILPSDNHDESSISVYHIETDNWLLTLQMTDPDLSRIFKILKPESDEECKDIKKNYLVKNHKLYRRVGDDIRLVVPRNARWQICRYNHDDVGHLGISKTTERIQSVFWFPKSRRFIKKYVKSCIQCAFNKDDVSRQKTGQLYPIEKVGIPFHTIHIDHLGPFVKSRNGNAYILTIVDGFTKYLFVKAVKDTKTRSAIKVLENIFYDFGLPSRIVSDRGTSFTSTTFKNFCGSHGIKHVLNAVACPRANGQAERYNQTILNALAKYNVGNDERNWDMYLGKIQWGVNNAMNSSTKRTATEALFGTRFRDDLNNKLDVGADAIPDTLQSLRDEVSANIRASQEKQKVSYDAGRIPASTYKEGDLIKITRTNFNNKGNSTKLLSKFIGPFKITKSLGNDRYKISEIPGFSKRKNKFKSVVSADRVRPWINIHSPDHKSSSNDNSSSSDGEQNNDDDKPCSGIESETND